MRVIKDVYTSMRVVSVIKGSILFKKISVSLKAKAAATIITTTVIINPRIEGIFRLQSKLKWTDT